MINNGGAGTIIKAITNEAEIDEKKDAEGKWRIVGILGPENIPDPKGSMYMVSTEGLITAAPHHGIYMKTGDAGGTEVVEIFDFGTEGGGGMTYVGSTGANIIVTINTVGTTGTVGASIVAGSLSKGLMDAEINNIFNYTGYPQVLNSGALTLSGAANELDARVGKLVDLDLGQTVNFENIVEAINFLGFDGMM